MNAMWLLGLWVLLGSVGALRLTLRREAVRPHGEGSQRLSLNTTFSGELGRRLYVTAYLGEPPQKASLALDLQSPTSWVPGSNCTIQSTFACAINWNYTAYYPQLSRRSRPWNSAAYSEGVLGQMHSDSLGFSAGQTLLDDFQFLVGEKIYDLEANVGGRLGLARSLTGESSLLQTLANRQLFQPPVFAIRMFRGPIQKAGEIAFGGAVESLCPNAFQGADRLSANFQWQFVIQNLSIGAMTLHTSFAILDLNTEFIEIPERALRHLELEYEGFNPMEVFDCQRKPQLLYIRLQIGSTNFALTDENLMEKQVASGLCGWRIRRSRDWYWHLGDAFMEKRCFGFDYGTNEVIFYK